MGHDSFDEGDIESIATNAAEGVFAEKAAGLVRRLARVAAADRANELRHRAAGAAGERALWRGKSQAAGHRSDAALHFCARWHAAATRHAELLAAILGLAAKYGFDEHSSECQELRDARAEAASAVELLRAWPG